MTADRRTARRERLTDLALIALGSLLFALSVVIFSAPNDIAPGGVTGLATMLNYLFRLPIGVMSVAINIPLLLIGWKRLGHRFLLRTLLGLLLSSAMTDLLALFMPAFRGEPMLVCLFGGALAGLGLGLILSRGATTAGSEIVGRLLEQRFPHVPIGRLILLVDAAVVLLSAAVYRQLESPLYATVFIFVSSLVTDRVVYGGRAGRMAMILTSRQPELTEQIMQKLDRGVTLLEATGGYTGRAQKMLLCVVSREEAAPLKRLVFELDPGAFFMMLSTDEVYGFGWQDPQK